MSTDKQSPNNQSINHTQIARAIFAAAESMGMADRHQIEQLTNLAIERLEPKPLPGMEHLVPKSGKKRERPLSDLEIQAAVEVV